METMPTYTYAIIGGVVVFMLLVMIIGIRKSLSRAKGASQDLYSGLEGLGLKKTKEEGARSELQGAADERVSEVLRLQGRLHAGVTAGARRAVRHVRFPLRPGGVAA